MQWLVGQAMKKALFKPGAFFKGVILPLCEVTVANVVTNWNSLCYLSSLVLMDSQNVFLCVSTLNPRRVIVHVTDDLSLPLFCFPACMCTCDHFTNNLPTYGANAC